MTYSVKNTPIKGVLILEPKVFGDQRGFFYESFNAKAFEKATGLKRIFVQDNHSKSAKGVLRGLHYQTKHAQGKLVRVTTGSVFDVVVDIRPDSTTFGAWFGLELTSENKKQIWIPEGLAHGFFVLSDDAEVLYKTTDYYSPEYECSILWSDPFIGIEWPLGDVKIQPRLSEKDAKALKFHDQFFE